MCMLPALIALALAVAYWLPIRRWMGRWGTASADLTRVMAGDGLIAHPTYSGTMAVTINARPEHVWPWLVQMGYRRGGLYSYDWLDRLFGYLDGPSATSVLPEFQHLAVGDEIPLGQGPSWPVAAIEPQRALVLDMRSLGDFDWVWQFGLYPIDATRTRLVSRSRVRARTAAARLLTLAIEPAGFVMTRRMLLGIAQRAEALAAAPAGPTPRAGSGFKTPEGAAAFLAAYDAAMTAWPVPRDEMDVPSRFGMTHVVASGPQDAPPLVLLHGYMATSTMWTPNIADFSQDYRVYAIDVMGQPGKSVPGEPVRSESDYAEWLTATLDALHLDRVSLLGMSYGGWLALNYAIAAPHRVQRLVLLSPGGGFVPMARQFGPRGLLMVWFPSRFTVNSFMRWLGFRERPGDPQTTRVLDVMYLGLKHFRMALETLRVLPVMFPDDTLRAMRVPTLLLVGEHEVICDPATALDRARQLFPDVQCELVPRSSHEMCFSQHRLVDARVLAFLNESRRNASERVVA